MYMEYLIKWTALKILQIPSSYLTKKAAVPEAQFVSVFAH